MFAEVSFNQRFQFYRILVITWGFKKVFSFLSDRAKFRVKYKIIQPILLKNTKYKNPRELNDEPLTS